MAVAGPVWAVRTVTVPCSRQGPYRDTPTRTGNSKHHPKPRSTDQSQGISASCIAGQTTTWGGTSAIITVKPQHGARYTPILTVALRRTASLPCPKIGEVVLQAPWKTVI